MNELTQVRMNNWATLIKECRNSGQTVKDWCADNDLSINAYYYWLRKLRLAAIDMAGTETSCSTQFARVPSSVIQQSNDASLRIRQGDTLFEVSNDVSDSILSFLREVIIPC